MNLFTEYKSLRPLGEGTVPMCTEEVGVAIHRGNDEMYAKHMFTRAQGTKGRWNLSWFGAQFRKTRVLGEGLDLLQMTRQVFFHELFEDVALIYGPVVRKVQIIEYFSIELQGHHDGVLHTGVKEGLDVIFKEDLNPPIFFEYEG